MDTDHHSKITTQLKIKLTDILIEKNKVMFETTYFDETILTLWQFKNNVFKIMFDKIMRIILIKKSSNKTQIENY